jgi:acyl-CoA synthetase (NDP forming)
MNDDLNTLFYPRSIAVLGASPKRKWDWTSGNSWIAGSIKMGFHGSIYPVHPKAKSVLGYRAYRSVLDIPDEVDLAIFTIPSTAAVESVRQCAQKRVRYIHLLTAGFGETGLEQFAKIENELVNIAGTGKVRIVGPNCMGVYCPEGGLSWSNEFSAEPGAIGLFSQSGQQAYRVIRSGAPVGLRFSKVVSFGNACDLKAHDFLAYLARDSETTVIGAYLEGLAEGRAFMNTVKETSPRKPVIVWKGGQTEGGSRAALSHTSAIAGSRKIWDAFCTQTGIVQVHSLEEMIFTLRAFQLLPLPASAKVALLGSAGGGSVTTADIAEEEGLKVPRLTEATILRFGDFVPLEGTSVKNPLDILPYLRKQDNLLRVMELLKEEPNVDALIMNLSPVWVYRERGASGVSSYLERVLESKERFGKPLFFVLESPDDWHLDTIRKEAMKWLSEHGVAVFPDFRLAARILRLMKEYREFSLNQQRTD